MSVQAKICTGHVMRIESEGRSKDELVVKTEKRIRIEANGSKVILGIKHHLFDGRIITLGDWN